MKITVLGSAGSEFPNYRAPAFLLDDSVLLDAGTIGVALEEKAQWKIRHILLTHAHLDHIKGIPFLADNLILRNKINPISVMGLPSVLRTLKKNLLNDTVWPDFTSIPNPGNAVLMLKSIKMGKPFEVNGYKVVSHKVNHSVPAVGFVIEDKKGSRLLYTGDTGPTGAIWKETANRIDCAIIEVSLPNRMKRMAEMTGHLTAGLLRKEMQKMHNIPKRIFITHPKPQHIRQIMGEIRKLKMNNIRLLRDGEEIIF